jgi:hypothetical protein
MLRPLCRLPAEILGRILYFSQIPLQDNESGRRCLETRLGSYDRSWTEYTRVCRHVRAVALETPYLWTFIVLNFSQEPSAWAEICAKRAKDCLLEIYAPVDYTFNNMGTGAHLGKYLGRARSLDTNMWQKGAKDTRKPHAIALKTSMPMMEEMYCGMGGSKLNAEFMGGSCSSLLKLILYDITYALHEGSPIFSALRILELNHRSRTEQIRQFIILLNHTPCLEALSINMSSALVVSDNDHLTPIVLPHLRRLHLNASLDATLAFIKIVPLPSNDLFIYVSRQARYQVEPLIPELHTYMLRFWSKVVNDRPFPPGRIEWIPQSDCHVVVGSRFAFESDTASHDPQIFFSCWVNTPGLAPQIIELVESVHIEGAISGSAEHVLDTLNEHLLYLSVKNIAYVRDLPRGLVDWVHERARVGRRLETVTFIDCPSLGGGRNPSIKDFAGKLQRDDLVRNVVWTQRK